MTNKTNVLANISNIEKNNQMHCALNTQYIINKYKYFSQLHRSYTYKNISGQIKTGCIDLT